jgi:glycosyltransferase XagB
MASSIIKLTACFMRDTMSITGDPSFVSADTVNENLPDYSILIALYKEDTVVKQLTDALKRLNYPKHKLDIHFLLEEDVSATKQSLLAAGLEPHMQIWVQPDSQPRTKPKALNYGLERCKGELVVVYDAEDQPHFDQLLEAANRFQLAPPKLACLQSPLRPRPLNGFTQRHFACEYAVQFELVLPALARLNLPLPLGGTSNHFKTDVLRQIGGWDAYNVTEDADLGFRLAHYGYQIGMIHRPTYECPPKSTRQWLPQRSRWIKGYLQTLIVHSRSPHDHIQIALFLTLGLGVLTSFCYGPYLAFMVAKLLLASLYGSFFNLSIYDAILWFTGTFSALFTAREAKKYAGNRFEAKDMLSLPFYLSLGFIASVFALYQLLTKPFHWEKTDHEPLVEALQ